MLLNTIPAEWQYASTASALDDAVCFVITSFSLGDPRSHGSGCGFFKLEMVVASED